MRSIIKTLAFAVTGLTLFTGCGKDNFELGSVDAPTNVTVTAIPQGIDATHPNGDGSGKVDIVVSGNGIMGTTIDLDANNQADFKSYPSGKTTASYTDNGTHTYTITTQVFGTGGKTTLATTDVTVLFVFVPSEEIVAALTGTGSKTWRVDSFTTAHFGVGPWSTTSTTPEWYGAAPGEKRDQPCFYSARFTFTKTGSSYTITSTTPVGAFTKTGADAGGLPGIPASGAEGCYTYAGGTTPFSWIPPSSGIAADKSTGHSIVLGGTTTFIGYGAVQKQYEILEISETTVYFRVRGTETGNAWYIRLIPA